MKRIITIYGLIAGAIVSTLILLSTPLWNAGIVTFENGAIIGYSTMVISLSVIFFGVKSYRDKQPDGAVSFWKAFQIGIFITLIAGVMYAIAWEISFNNMSEDFITKMTDYYFEQMKSDGATEADLVKAREQWAAYKNPLIRFPITITEILPVGIIITLISAALLRRKEFLPATETASA